MRAYSYQLDRRNNILRGSEKQYSKVSELAVAKSTDGDGLIAFIADANAEQQTAVNTLLKQHGLQMYPSKKSGLFVVGNAKRDTTNDVECEVA